MITLKKILVPTDFSNTSEVALKYAGALVQEFDASLDVLHVLEDPLVYPATMEWYPIPTTNYRAEMEKGARERLESFLPSAEREELRAKLAVVWGSPFVEIIRYAKAENIDLIVMGSLGLGPVGHMLMGSVAERVVRKAPCPVLTVRHPEHEFVMP
jgi:nucleotide-binding universal stress UspA family protein